MGAAPNGRRERCLAVPRFTYRKQAALRSTLLFLCQDTVDAVPHHFVHFLPHVLEPVVSFQYGFGLSRRKMSVFVGALNYLRPHRLGYYEEYVALNTPK